MYSFYVKIKFCLDACLPFCTMVQILHMNMFLNIYKVCVALLKMNKLLKNLVMRSVISKMKIT